MFKPKDVRERVTAKLQASRVFTEEAFHAAYHVEMVVELERLRQRAGALRTFLGARARHPEKGWVMLDSKDAANFQELVAAFFEEAGIPVTVNQGASNTRQETKAVAR